MFGFFIFVGKVAIKMIQSKLPKVGTTIFTVMSQLAQTHNAINLGQGFPDYPMNSTLHELVGKAMANGANQYVHMNGLPQLREVLAEKVSYLYQTKVNPDTEITVTPGGTYALYTALTTIVQPGDEVIVFEPAYDCYIPTIELNGGIAITIPLQFPSYNIDWDLVKQKLSPKTRAIMINSPHNPTGAVLSVDDMQQLAEITRDTDIIIISDEVYEHLIFDGKQHESVLKYPELLQRAFVSFSFGKVYHCTGWKMGYSIAPAAFMSEFRKIHQFNCFTCNTPMQVALAEFLQDRSQYLELGIFLQNKRDYLKTALGNTRLKPLPSFGSYFQLYDYGAISDESEKDFAIRLTKEYGVATIPTSAFYNTETNNKTLRFCFSKKEETLHAAAERLQKL